MNTPETAHHTKLTETVSVRFDTESKRALSALAEFEGLDPSAKLRQLADEYIEKKRGELAVLLGVFGHG